MKTLPLAGAIFGVTLVFCACVRVKVVYPPLQQLETPVEKLRRTMMEMRSLGTALESFSIDHSFYPEMPEARQKISDHVEVSPVVGIFSQMSNYIRVMPANDPWGNPYLYWSAGQQYALISTGSDGKITDSKYLSEVLRKLADDGAVVSQGTAMCMEDEIVFTAGHFLQWPSDQIAPCAGSD